MAERRTFESFLPSVTEKLKPLLDAFLEKLGIRRGREEVGRLQKMEKMGRVTTGHVPEMYREISEQFGLEETGYRATHQGQILEQAMKLFGFEEEWVRMQEQMEFQARQSELDRALSRELARLSGGGGGGGISFDFGNMFGGGGKVTPDFRPPKPIVDVYGDWSQRRAKPVYKGKRQYGTVEEATKRRVQKPTIKSTSYKIPKATYYRGRRLGRI